MTPLFMSLACVNSAKNMRWLSCVRKRKSRARAHVLLFRSEYRGLESQSHSKYMWNPRKKVSTRWLFHLIVGTFQRGHFSKLANFPATIFSQWNKRAPVKSRLDREKEKTKRNNCQANALMFTYLNIVFASYLHFNSASINDVDALRLLKCAEWRKNKRKIKG